MSITYTDTAADVIKGIATLDRGDLENVQQAINQRVRYLRDMRAATNKATLKPGTRVRTKGLRPKYLNNLNGEVIAEATRRKGDIMVLVDEADRWQITRYSHNGKLSVPASALEAV